MTTEKQEPPFPAYVGTAGEWTWRGDPAEGTHRAVAMLAEPDQVGNKHVMVALARIPPGMQAPWHVHEDFEEFVYILEGTGEFITDTHGTQPIGPGSINIISPGTWHTHRPTGDEDLVFLWGYSPPGNQLKT